MVMWAIPTDPYNWLGVGNRCYVGMHVRFIRRPARFGCISCPRRFESLRLGSNHGLGPGGLRHGQSTESQRDPGLAPFFPAVTVMLLRIPGAPPIDARCVASSGLQCSHFSGFAGKYGRQVRKTSKTQALKCTMHTAMISYGLRRLIYIS